MLGVLALFAGHVSYPRVQNLRVYLAGYSVGLQSILYALFVGFSSYYPDAIARPPVGYDELIFVVALLLCYGYTLAAAVPDLPCDSNDDLGPRRDAARPARRRAILPRRIRAFFGLSSRIRLVSLPALTAALLVAGVVIVNAVLKPQSFYLRGAFSGLAILAGGTWVLVPVLDAFGYGEVSPGFVALLYAGVVPLFLVVSLLAHILARMEHRVSYDPLLQIYNREYCNQVVAEQSSVVTRPPLAIMMIDIDHFKDVNDTYGHQAGDRILFAVAQMVQKSVVPEGVVCRYGGEELIVFIPKPYRSRYRTARAASARQHRADGNDREVETDQRDGLHGHLRPAVGPRSGFARHPRGRQGALCREGERPQSGPVRADQRSIHAAPAVTPATSELSKFTTSLFTKPSPRTRSFGPLACIRRSVVEPSWRPVLRLYCRAEEAVRRRADESGDRDDEQGRHPGVSDRPGGPDDDARSPNPPPQGSD